MMSEKYFDLKKQLELLGYTKHFPPNALPLVECLTADLLQTTRSLKDYMETAQDALRQRDELVLQIEPYKLDNAALLKENNQLKKLLIELKEEHMKAIKELTRKVKYLQNDLCVKEDMIMKLKQQCKDNNRSSVMANTVSFKNKIKQVDSKTSAECNCLPPDEVVSSNKINELDKEIKDLKEYCDRYKDENSVLEKMVENRDGEIERLKSLLEGGKPASAVMKAYSETDYCRIMSQISVNYKEIHEIQSENASLKRQLQKSLEKQHEAMLNAVKLADKNKLLEEELCKLDKLALKVEDECNYQIKTKNSENISLREQVHVLLCKNNQLQTELATNRNESIQKLENSVAEIQKIKDYLNSALKEKDEFFQQVKTLESLNKSLQDKLTVALTNMSNVRNDNASNFATKDDVLDLMEKEKQDFMSNSLLVQKKVAEALKDFSNTFCSAQKHSLCPPHDVEQLSKKISEIENKVTELEKENNELKSVQKSDHGDGFLVEKIKELETKNSQLQKENMMFCYQNQTSSQVDDMQFNKLKNTITKLNEEIETLVGKINLLKNENKETVTQLNKALDTIDTLKKELLTNRYHHDKLEEENASFRLANISARSEKGSIDHMKDECHYLREQILHMQSDLTKEKSVVMQMKNYQSEGEKHINELQNELITVKKQLASSNERCFILENKAKDFSAEILSLRIEKSKLFEDLQGLDKKRHDLITQIDKNNEYLHSLEEQNKQKTFIIEKFEHDLTELKHANSLINVNEQKIKDYGSKLHVLNLENQRLKEHLDNLTAENRRLQNCLESTSNALKNANTEYERSQKEAESLRLQLQHYVAEVKRIEDMLSHKEAERADMLENFASLSVEANLLENTNHSLENESASKSLQLQKIKNKIEELEEKLLNKEREIESKCAQISNLSYKYSKIEAELKLVTEEKVSLEKNNNYLKNLTIKLESEKKTMGQGLQNTDSELQLYEHKIKKLMEEKAKLELENCQLKANTQAVENLLSAARREVVELKLALQDATSETQLLKEQLYKFNEEFIKSHDLTVPGSHTSRTTVIEEKVGVSSQYGDLAEKNYSDLTNKTLFYYKRGSTL